MNDANHFASIQRPAGRKFIGFRSLVVWVAVSILGGALADQTPAQDTEAALPRIAAGTKVGDPNAKRWNRLVLLAKPRIASGAVDSLSESIRNASTTFSLTIMATVKPYSATDGSQRYQLAEVGVGFSVPINGVQTVVTYDTIGQQGADPGFIGRQVLSENEEQIKTVRAVVRSTTLLIFDTPALMLRQNKHVDVIGRHLVWIDPMTGRGAMVVWLLGKDAAGKLVPVNEPLRLVATGTKEDRKIHVDGDEFFLGVPSARAFALEDLPPGTPIAWTASLAKYAGLPSYDAKSLGHLSTALNQAITASRPADATSK